MMNFAPMRASRLVEALAIAGLAFAPAAQAQQRSEEHTSELQSLPTTSYAVFCLDRKSVV